MTAQRPFRFGVNMVVPEFRSNWIEKCRRAEELGFDVIGVADHLGLPAPFPAMILAAEATERVRLNTFVLNTAFYNPVLLARDVAGADQFTDGRVEGQVRSSRHGSVDIVARLTSPDTSATKANTFGCTVAIHDRIENHRRSSARSGSPVVHMQLEPGSGQSPCWGAAES
ncbi:LLM class flavin-dependent oxidoreductase [Nocardia abscessus]|uniref:LLM class flavin-dependent oxidoreductase n=1 Tax=Nocardia abscessus TaxID=120957 RepID=UPI003CC7EAA2